MAEPLSFTVSGGRPEDIGPQRDLELLIETLHRSGTLRALRGLFGRLPEVTDVLLESLDHEGGKNAMANAALSLTALTRVDPDRLQRVLRALAKAVEATGEAKRSEHPPMLPTLIAMAASRDARRGLHAVLVLLRTFGEELGRDRELLETRP